MQSEIINRLKLAIADAEADIAQDYVDAETTGERPDLHDNEITLSLEDAKALEAALSAAEPVKTDCEFCKGSGLEFILAGHGNINEEPCSTCGGTGKEGRHSICRDCDEIQSARKPFAFNVRIEGWGEELLYTEDGAKSLITRLRRTKGQDGEVTITPLYAALSAQVQDVAGEETTTRFYIEWIAAARPPVHPEPMTGRHIFETFDLALQHMKSQANDAQFVSLEVRQTTVIYIDRSADMRAALAAAPAKQEGT